MEPKSESGSESGSEEESSNGDNAKDTVILDSGTG